MCVKFQLSLSKSSRDIKGIVLPAGSVHLQAREWQFDPDSASQSQFPLLPPTAAIRYSLHHTISLKCMLIQCYYNTRLNSWVYFSLPVNMQVTLMKTKQLTNPLVVCVCLWLHSSTVWHPTLQPCHSSTAVHKTNANRHIVQASLSYYMKLNDAEMWIQHSVVPITTRTAAIYRKHHNQQPNADDASLRPAQCIHRHIDLHIYSI